MALIIIPLAGPDFYTERFGIRPLYQVGSSTLIEHILSRRPWIDSDGNRTVFVLRDVGEHTKIMCSYIKNRFPLSDIVVLGRLSEGAPLSALAGISSFKSLDEPVVVDLADIGFETGINLLKYFRDKPNVDAVVPYFSSIDPKYSYLRLNGNCVISAREKEVISTNASAGVYIFRNAEVYLRALIYCLNTPSVCKIGAAFFICPSVNGLIEGGREVHAIKVENVEPIGALFHAPE